MRKTGPVSTVLFLSCIAATATIAALAQPKSTDSPIQVKVVIVAMFEPGADTGDTPGELQYWVERDRLDRVYPLPAAYHPARMNDQGELAIVTGQGTAHAAASIMALGLDPRFDLTHAYWIVAGIAGGSPDRASLGSAVWANWIVDGDLGYEIDAREIPSTWPTGMVPLRKERPYELPADAEPGQIFQTNRPLTLWAYNQTKNIKLADSAKLAEIRGHFDGTMAQTPPKVLLGDEVSSSTYWHGDLMDTWATRWMDYFTGGQGRFATTAMEDTGTLESLSQLAAAGRVDWQRILVLRTVSNYDRQPRGVDAVTSLAYQRVSRFGAYLPSLESAYTVGHAVASELLSNWTVYRDHIPQPR